MTVKDKSTEEKILDAAREVFVQKGMDGARTQEIATKAGINKALLHYYYRTKDALFLAVFKMVIKKAIPSLTDLLTSDISFIELIETFIERYISVILKNPFLPGFIIHEINRNPDKLANIMKESGINPELFFNMVKKAVDEKIIRPVDPKHLIINIFSLCIFPVVGRPMMQRVFFDNNSKDYDKFLHERSKEVAGFVLNSIRL